MKRMISVQVVPNDELTKTAADWILDGLAGVADVFAIAAAGIAIYIFLTKRSEISSVFRLLLEYGYQISLSELMSKLERIVQLRVANAEEKEEIKNIMSDIVGQLRGNSKLKSQCKKELETLENHALGKNPFTEQEKRIIVSQLREKLKQLRMEDFDEHQGGEK